MALFEKIGKTANRLFAKYSSDPNLFRKISNSARDINATVQKVGNFLTPLSMVNPNTAVGLQGLLTGSRTVSNALEKGYQRIKK